MIAGPHIPAGAQPPAMQEIPCPDAKTSLWATGQKIFALRSGLLPWCAKRIRRALFSFENSRFSSRQAPIKAFKWAVPCLRLNRCPKEVSDLLSMFADFVTCIKCNPVV